MIRLSVTRYLTTQRLRECVAAAASLSAFIAGLKAIYYVDAATVNRQGWLYAASDWLYLAVNGSALFSGPVWDLHSVFSLGISLFVFSVFGLTLLTLGTCLLSGYICGGAAWTEAKARVFETSAMSAQFPEPRGNPATSRLAGTPGEDQPAA